MASDNKLATIGEVKGLIGKIDSNAGISFVDASIGGGYFYVNGFHPDYVLSGEDVSVNKSWWEDGYGIVEVTAWTTSAPDTSILYKYLYYGILCGVAYSTGGFEAQEEGYEFVGYKNFCTYIPKFHVNNTTRVFVDKNSDSGMSKETDYRITSTDKNQFKQSIINGDWMEYEFSNMVSDIKITKDQISTMSLRGSSSIDVYTASWQEEEPVLDSSTGEQLYDDNGKPLYQMVEKTDYYEEPTPEVENDLLE